MCSIMKATVKNQVATGRKAAVKNSFMCLTKNSKADSEINPFLKQLFFSILQSRFLFCWRRGIQQMYTQTRSLNGSGRNQTNQSHSHLAHFLAKAGLSCRAEFTFQLKINTCNLFHSYVTQRGTNLEAISFQFQHKIYIQKCPKKQPLSKNGANDLLLLTCFFLTSQYRFVVPVLLPLIVNFVLYRIGKRTTHAAPKFALQILRAMDSK